jgi:hypothetical protein
MMRTTVWILLAQITNIALILGGAAVLILLFIVLLRLLKALDIWINLHK